MYVVIELAPNRPPTAAATESTARMLRRPGTLPSSPTNPACSPTATTVPMVSKKSVSMIAKTATSSAGVKIWVIAIPVTPLLDVTVWNGAQNVEKVGSATTAFGNLVTPRSSAAAVATRMPHRMSPLTLQRHEREDREQADERDPDVLLREVAEADERRRVRADDAALVQPDDGDEQADAHADRALQVERDGVEDRLPQAREHEDEDEDALDEDHGHADLPRHVGLVRSR